MKKLLLCLLSALLLLVICSWCLIPSDLVTESHTSIKGSSLGLFRKMSDPKNVRKWWQGSIITVNGVMSYAYHGNTYTIRPVDMTLLSVVISSPGSTVQTRLYTFAVTKDSTKLLWLGNRLASRNPFIRLEEYYQARKLKSDMEFLLTGLHDYYSKPASLYGNVITTQKVIDTSMIAVFSVSKGYPSTAAIYEQIGKLQKFALAKGATQSGYPMINVNMTGTDMYKFEVALPINKTLASADGVVQKRLPPGLILETEVHGGIHTIEAAIEEIKNYGQDHKYNMYVIPYYSLISDRQTEPDSARWVTRVYCPIFQ